jgi:RNA recognition motif-containing protein
MSDSDIGLGSSPPVVTQKRKYEQDTELEVQLDAPEPPSKKALRKAKKIKVAKSDEDGIHADRKTHIAQGNGDSKGPSVPIFKEQPKRTGFGVWIGNLVFTTTAENLLSFFTSNKVNAIPAEEIARINLPTGVPRNGKPQNKGFAYVDFTSQAAVEKALLLSEKLLTGRRVLIKDAKNFEGRPKPEEAKKAEVATSKRIFVGNLAFDATREVLKQHFETCGPVADVFLATFEDSGKCKGYGWVTFEDLSSSEAAMRGWIDQLASEEGKDVKRRIWVNKIDGRKLRMEYAEDATTRYKKRYGKDAKKGDDLVLPLGEVDSRGELVRKEAGKRNEKSEKRHEKGQERNSNRSGRYAESTVAKLKGSIVKSEGTKVVFG